MKLSPTTKVFHMLVAFGMISIFALGIYMAETETFSLYPLHKSLGVLILGFALLRAMVRLREGWPKPLGQATKPQLLAAKAVHWGLIISTLLFPISGMMMSGAGGHGVFLFGLEVIAHNADPVSGKAIPLNENLAAIGHEIHELLVPVLISLLVLHIAGAIKHHVIDKDATLTRMFSFK
ncbi:cytochrome b [Thalassomonas viridans]|uniref:Cytochrome b n=1 Tax=Thalassomonas viridans TaxID=137584 RepID=A0AAE9Z3Z0_9GAMM|nr:cytochrome b [Thalassomonas viridans]WDE05857.1 cytochrome b [Thalassomonas viridans]